MDEEQVPRRKLSALDMMEHNRPLRRHWVARLVASFVDFFTALVVAGILGFVIGGDLGPFSIVINTILALFWIFYSAIMEYLFGFTLGKKLMRLRVQSLKGGLDLWRAILRNISKVYLPVLVIDTLIGMATGGDPRQRFLDRVANTTVIREGKAGRKEENEI